MQFLLPHMDERATVSKLLGRVDKERRNLKDRLDDESVAIVESETDCELNDLIDHSAQNQPRVALKPKRSRNDTEASSAANISYWNTSSREGIQTVNSNTQ